MKNKKGSVMVEAAIIFPVVILSVMTVIYFITGLYAEVICSTALHMKLISEAGKISETVLYTGEELCDKDISGMFDGMTVTHENTLFRNVLKGETGSKQKIDGIIKKTDVREYQDTVNVIDEEVYIRCADVVSGVVNAGVY